MRFKIKDKNTGEYIVTEMKGLLANIFNQLQYIEGQVSLLETFGVDVDLYVEDDNKEWVLTTIEREREYYRKLGLISKR